MTTKNKLQDTTALVEETLERIEPRLRHLARRQIAKAPELVELSADDLYQQMCLKIIEKVSIDDNFLLQKDAYLCQYALWKTMSYIKRIRYSYADWHVEVEIEDSDEVFYCNGRAGPEPSKAVEVREVYDLLNNCPEDFQKLWQLLLEGYSYKEVSERTGLSPYSVGSRKKKLLRVLREAYITPKDRKPIVLEALHVVG